MTDDLLEQVRLLSNLETDNRKLLQIVLMGRQKVRPVESTQAASCASVSRCVFTCHRCPRHEMAETYPRIACTFPVATANLTSPGHALWRVHRYSGGIPRLVNALCDKGAARWFREPDRTHQLQTVGRAIRELEGNI